MITVHAFARYRELLGFEHLELPLPQPPTCAGLLRQPQLAGLPREAMVAVNQAFAREETPLSDGDEIALLPPVSGG